MSRHEYVRRALRKVYSAISTISGYGPFWRFYKHHAVTSISIAYDSSCMESSKSGRPFCISTVDLSFDSLATANYKTRQGLQVLFGDTGFLATSLRDSACTGPACSLLSHRLSGPAGYSPPSCVSFSLAFPGFSCVDGCVKPSQRTYIDSIAGFNGIYQLRWAWTNNINKHTTCAGDYG